jgi:hypothetical protein
MERGKLYTRVGLLGHDLDDMCNLDAWRRLDELPAWTIA